MVSSAVHPFLVSLYHLQASVYPILVFYYSLYISFFSFLFFFSFFFLLNSFPMHTSLQSFLTDCITNKSVQIKKQSSTLKYGIVKPSLLSVLAQSCSYCITICEVTAASKAVVRCSSVQEYLCLKMLKAFHYNT